MMDEVVVCAADLDDAAHAAAVLELVDDYARDPFGAGRPLATAVRAALVEGLRAHPTTLVFLAFVGGAPAGVAVCFRGFSTFAARPLLNVHDLSVAKRFRGRGIARRLLDAVEATARELACCKLTLEVRGDNVRAQALYRSFGFRLPARPGDATQTFFLEKLLT